jgi:hypothetical protein
MADFMTVAWKVYGIKLMTKSFFATSASRAAPSVTSSEIGWAFLTPAESFLADSRVLQAKMLLTGCDERIGMFGHTNGDVNACITENVKGWSCYEARPKHKNFPAELLDKIGEHLKNFSLL